MRENIYIQTSFFSIPFTGNDLESQKKKNHSFEKYKPQIHCILILYCVVFLKIFLCGCCVCAFYIKIKTGNTGLLSTCFAHNA